MNSRIPPHLLAGSDQHQAALKVTNDKHIKHAMGVLERVKDPLITAITLSEGIIDACELRDNERGVVTAQLLALMYVNEAQRRLDEEKEEKD